MHLRSPNFIRNTLQKRLNSFYTTSSSIKAKATATSSKIETADNTTNSNAESNRDWNHFENNSSKDALPFSFSNSYTLGLKMLAFIGAGVGLPLAVVKIHMNRS